MITAMDSIGNITKLDRPVLLIGLMGAGKSTVGRRLARALNLPFCDSDDEITEAAGCSIADIFEIYGESIFRDLEERVILRLLGEPSQILASGGGAFINPRIREAVLERATTIWLKADIDTLLERVSRRNIRPLLKKGDKRAILTRLMEERYPIYAQAHITVDSSNGTHEDIVRAIIGELKKLESSSHDG